MKKLSGRILLTLLLTIIIWIVCSPVTPNGGETEETTLLILSLEEMGRRSAEYSGAPIEAIIELDQDTTFNTISWHTGQGDPQFTDSILTKKDKQFSVQLVWKKYPLVKDSASGMYYDTVYVSMGGGLKKSNKVVVKVTNLPVIADSSLFHTTLFRGSDSIWFYTFSDTVTKVSRYKLRFFAHDLDGKPHSVQVRVKKGVVHQNSLVSTEMEYEPPKNDFTDTITFIAYDQKGSQAIRRLVITRISPNIPASIDSVLVKSTILKGSGEFKVGFAVLDSLKLRLFAHDTLGAVTTVKWISNNSTISADSADQFRATWKCTSNKCADTIPDTSFVIDSIKIVVIDNRGDTTLKTIVINKGKVNQPPVVNELLFDDKQVNFTNTTVTVNAIGGETYPLKLKVSDPENDSITVTWEASSSEQLPKTEGSSAMFLTPMKLGTDTVTITISDGKSTIKRSVVIKVTDIGPIIDSISIADTMIITSDSIIYYEVKAKDTLLIFGYAFDRDIKEDTLKFTWSAGKQERFIKRQNNAARYVLPANDLNDTIIFSVQDGTAQTVRKIVLSPRNSIPVIDSIQGSGKTLKKLLLNEYLDIVKVSDTVDYKAFARDPEGGSLDYQWSVSDSLRLIGTTGAVTRYICDSVYYKDTITINVIDSMNASIKQRIILQIDTAALP